jgi:hypothetical protein
MAIAGRRAPLIQSLVEGEPKMSTAVWTRSLKVNSVAETALKAAAWSWFVVAVLGQWIFVVYIVSFYGRSVVEGDWARWNRVLFHGYVPGDNMGNGALAIHILLAAVITVGGPLQLIPQIRARVPSFHRWNGRMYVLAAFTTSIVALYLIWIRGGTIGDVIQNLASSLNAVLIMLCAAMALRYAVARDFATHRRWALRLFLVVSGVWFFRVGLMLSFLLFRGPFGFDLTTFHGPFLTFLAFAQCLLPLAVLELYLRTQALPGATRRIGMAAGLLVLTVAMGAGIFGATMGMWLPIIKVAYDSRKSIAGTLTATIASRGVDEAARQYADLKAAAPATYNFDEGELDSLGYHLLHTSKVKEAIRIFQLNVEAFPKSSNAYDSFAEAYMDDGNKPQAIANYQKSLQLNPKNRNAVQMLQKLNAP